MAKNQIMRITLKSYDHKLVDASAAKIVEVLKKNERNFSGPIPLPTKKEVVTILRAVHKYKDSREQFEQRTHKRLINVYECDAQDAAALARANIELPAGVEVRITMKEKK